MDSVKSTARPSLLHLTVLVILCHGVRYNDAACPHECLCLPDTNSVFMEEEWTVSCVHIDELPSSWPEDIQPLREVYFSGLNIVEIPDKYFQNFTSVRKLAIRNSAIGRIHPGAFEGVNGHFSDAVIMLSYNDIPVIEGGAFRGISNVASLQIIGGRIGTIKAQAFSSMDIGCIIVSGAAIGKFDQNAFGEQLTLNKHFDLTNSLNAFPEELRRVVPDIDAIAFEGCEEGKILNSNVSFVSLVSNAISYISSGSFGGIHDSSFLSLHNNVIGIVKSGIFNGMTNVSTIGFTYNIMEGLSRYAFAGAVHMQHFVLHTNTAGCTAEGATDGLPDGKVTDINNGFEPVTEDDNSSICLEIQVPDTTIAPTTTPDDTTTWKVPVTTQANNAPRTTTPRICLLVTVIWLLGLA